MLVYRITCMESEYLVDATGEFSNSFLLINLNHLKAVWATQVTNARTHALVAAHKKLVLWE